MTAYLDSTISNSGFGVEPRLRQNVESARPVRIAYQTPGIRRFVRAEYAAYSAPNSSTIILSSARTRSAQRIANAIKFDGPATQFGMTSAWPMEYSASAKHIGWRIRR